MSKGALLFSGIVIVAAIVISTGVLRILSIVLLGVLVAATAALYHFKGVDSDGVVWSNYTQTGTLFIAFVVLVVSIALRFTS